MEFHIFSSSKIRIVILAAVIVFGSLVLLALLKSNKPDNTTTNLESSSRPKTSEKVPSSGASQRPAKSAESIFVAEYSEDESVVRLWQLPALGGAKTLLGEFPAGIKQLELGSADDIFYIANTDIAHLGDGIWERSLSSRQERKIYTPAEKFFIDSYILSPDKKNLVIWLVSPTVEGFKGGQSRIILFSLDNSSEKILLEGEIENVVYYPLFWSPVTNLIYLNSYILGGAMNRGVVVVNSKTGSITPLPELSEGTYGGAIVLSHSGRFAAFTRQTTNQTSNLPPLGNGFIPSSERNTNAIVVVDLTSGKEQIVTESKTGMVYGNLIWGQDDALLYAQELAAKEGKVLPVAFKKFQPTLFDVGKTLGTSAEGEIITDLGQGILLLGIRSSPSGALGGLSGPTSAVYGSYYLLYPDNRYVKVYTEKNSQIVGIR